MLKRWIFLVAMIAFPALANAAPMNAIGADISVERGGLTLGFDYEFALKKDFAVGAYFHYFPKSTRTSDAGDGYVAFGPQAVVHYLSGPFDAYAAPGFGFVNVDSARANVSDTFTAGPRLALGLLYQINATLAAGIEESSYWIWFNADDNGLIMNDFALKVRASF